VPEASPIRFAKTGDGTHIAYQVLGEGPLDVLAFSMALVPIDMVDDEPSLARFQRRLASFGRLIRFDTRGVGLSDPVSPSSPPTLEQWVDDALAVLDAAGSKRAAVFSPGSPVALLLAASHPERVSGLVFVNGSARAASAPDYPIGFPLEALDSFLDSAMQAFEGEGPAEEVLAEIEATLQPDASEQGFDILTVVAPTMLGNEEFRRWWDRAGQRGASPATARALIRVFFEADIRQILPLIQAPTLIMHRKDNLFVPVEHGRYLAAHIPNATYVELPGADNLYWVGDDRVLDDTEEFLTGVRHGPDPDRLLAAVLFTDIVGSTARIVEVGERRWRDLLERHDAAVRRQLERFGGHEVQTTGDGMLATFDGPARSVYCACAIRDAAGQLGLEIRAGIHAGEIEVRGKNVGGLAVHIAARVAALAGPRQVLASSTVKDLVAGSRIGFEDSGSHLLKGVPDEWRLFSVEST
jgi:class 3 adenylate cyclase